MFINEHYKAFETDLLSYGYEIKDIGRSISWGALYSLVNNLGLDSATAKDIDREMSLWGTTFKTNAILADIYDILALINANLVAIGSRQHTKAPKRYPRPFGKEDDNVQHFGKDAVSVDELKELFANKRKK